MAPGVTIIGLGPGDPGQLSLEAWRLLEAAPEVYLRTGRHPTVEALPRAAIYATFDEVYEREETFEAVYEEIARRVLALGERPDGVLYAVPGHPLVGETSVVRILEMAQAHDLPVRIVAGISFLEPTLTALGLDALDGLQICDATLLAQRLHPLLDPDVGALIGQLYSRELAADVKLTLMNLYHDEHPVHLVYHAGMPDERVRDLPLYELDRQTDFDHLTSAYLPPLARPGGLSSYQEIMARLRAPEGCPWDREQTHRSLRTYLLEETYEVLAALDADDPKLLKEELGDLLLQILFHAQIAQENGDFGLTDSMAYAIEKLVRRHPHVFGQASVANAEEVLLNWEQIKRQEKAEANVDRPFVSMLSGINRALPALSQAMEVQKRVARVGFDWPGIQPVLDKVLEEMDELRAAQDAQSRSAEIGDLLFSLVNLARWMEHDPESALREATARFVRRFEAIERHASERDIPLEQMTLEEMDRIWESAKEAE
ncbi:MAG: nucleoside triphosphate pyrophosphohydrolase [Anaerolineae bacterium]|nr:nucleoside triphosphate pyrophosphohydrolase [Anaerolineae bacterium]